MILAAGLSSRYRAADPSVATKLVAELDGIPIVRRVAEAALASRARPIVVVTGHAAIGVRHALDGLDLDFAHNAVFAEGLSTSLAAGLAALPPDVGGALVLLGDMPDVSASLLDTLIAAFVEARDAEAVVPVHAGRRGNPALLGRALFGRALTLTGDEGARRLLAAARVHELATADPAVSVDIDDPHALEASRGRTPWGTRYNAPRRGG